MNRRQFIGTSLTGAGAMAVAGPAVRGAQVSTRNSIEEPVILECAVNGGTTKAINPLAPETPSEIAAEIMKVLDAGATIVHSHSNQPIEDVEVAAKSYIEAYRPVKARYPDAILYATANFDPQLYALTRQTWPGSVQCGHHRILAALGLTNMVLFDTGVSPLGVYDEDGLPRAKGFFWYGFWPDDCRYIKKVCDDFGTGASISVFEPGWMKNVVAMARAGSLPRGSKVNIYFATDNYACMAPPIPEALELYLKMIEGLDIKWSVGLIGNKSIMDTPLARMALERGGSFRVGLEDFAKGPSNLEQMGRAKDIINRVGRPIVNGAEAIEYLDIPFAATRR